MGYPLSREIILKSFNLILCAYSEELFEIYIYIYIYKYKKKG